MSLNLLQHLLVGGATFRDATGLLEDLSWAESQRTVPHVPYTLGELLAHLEVTQRISLRLASGELNTWPEGLNVWPEAPDSQEQFQTLLYDLTLGLAQASALATAPSSRAHDLLLDLAVHNAYHWGQVALLRRLHGTLPESVPA